jgi:magnesium transporter
VLTVFQETTGFVHPNSLQGVPADAIWIDLVTPTAEETAFIASQKNVRIPSIDELSEIESSSRLAVNHDVIYVSIPAVAQGDTPDAYLTPTGFILTKGVLITVRFASLSTFDKVAEQVKQDKDLQSALAIFAALLEAIVDRGADVLERLGADLDKVSKSVFRGDPSRPKHAVRSNNTLRRALTTVGVTGDRLALARDALLTGRIGSNDEAVTFLRKACPALLLAASALECRQSNADPDPLFSGRTSLPSQVDACITLVSQRRRVRRRSR